MGSIGKSETETCNTDIRLVEQLGELIGICCKHAYTINNTFIYLFTQLGEGHSVHLHEDSNPHLDLLNSVNTTSDWNWDWPTQGGFIVSTRPGSEDCN